MTQKEIEKFLDRTKFYVDCRSREVQEKLFKLGYYWLSNGQQVQFTEKPFIFIKDYNLTYSSDMNLFMNDRGRKITVDEILQIKLTPPKYQPFKNRDECWNEMLKHQPFGWIKRNSGICYNIATIDNTSIYFCDTTQCFYRDALENHCFMDGTPFGIKENRI